MTGPFVSCARQTASANQQALASQSGHKSRITLWPSMAASGPAMTTEAPSTQDLKLAITAPPLVLTQVMQRDAFQMDHDKALRGNRAKAGRIAQEAKKATTAILSRGVCSDDQPSMA